MVFQRPLHMCIYSSVLWSEDKVSLPCHILFFLFFFFHKIARFNKPYQSDGPGKLSYIQPWAVKAEVETYHSQTSAETLVERIETGCQLRGICCSAPNVWWYQILWLTTLASSWQSLHAAFIRYYWSLMEVGWCWWKPWNINKSSRLISKAAGTGIQDRTGQQPSCIKVLLLPKLYVTYLLLTSSK